MVKRKSCYYFTEKSRANRRGDSGLRCSGPGPKKQTISMCSSKFMALQNSVLVSAQKQSRKSSPEVQSVVCRNTVDEICAEHTKHNICGNTSCPCRDCHQWSVQGVLCYHPELSSENAASPTLKKNQTNKKTQRNNVPLYK